MEALGVAASIIQVAAVGLALAQTLYKFCDETSSSNEQVKDLAFYVRSTSLVLEEIGKVFQNEDQGSRPMVSQNAIVTAKEIVQKCTGTFSELQEIVDSAEQSALGVFKFTMKASRLKVLQFGLGEMRSNLQCMMQVIIYARLKAEPRPTFNESEQRRLIAELIAQQMRAAEEYKQAESQHAAHDSNKISPSVENTPSQPGTNGSNTLSASQLPTNNSNGTLSETENSKTRPISVRNQGPCPTEPPQFPERHTSQPPAISTSTTQAKARTVYLDALYMVCCPCFARRRRALLPTASCSQGGLELGLESPGPMRMRRTWSELSGESDVDRLVNIWTTLYDQGEM